MHGDKGSVSAVADGVVFGDNCNDWMMLDIGWLCWCMRDAMDFLEYV